MQKIARIALIVALTILFGNGVKAQEYKEISPYKLPLQKPAHDIKLNLYSFLGAPSVEYECVFPKGVGVGANYIYMFYPDLFEFTNMLVPFARVYTGRKNNGAGFFLEFNTAFIDTYGYDDWYLPTNSGVLSAHRVLGWGLGIGLGVKFMSSLHGLFGEFSMGAGNILVNTNHVGWYPRLNLCIGKRF